MKGTRILLVVEHGENEDERKHTRLWKKQIQRCGMFIARTVKVPKPYDADWSGILLKQIAAFIHTQILPVVCIGTHLFSLVGTDPLLTFIPQQPVVSHGLLFLPYVNCQNQFHSFEFIAERWLQSIKPHMLKQPFSAQTSHEVVDVPFMEDIHSPYYVWAVEPQDDDYLKVYFLEEGKSTMLCTLYNANAVEMYIWPPIADVYHFDSRFVGIRSDRVDTEASLLHYGLFDPVHATVLDVPQKRMHGVKDWAKKNNHLAFYKNAIDVVQVFLKKHGLSMGKMYQKGRAIGELDKHHINYSVLSVDARPDGHIMRIAVCTNGRTYLFTDVDAWWGFWMKETPLVTLTLNKHTVALLDYAMQVKNPGSVEMYRTCKYPQVHWNLWDAMRTNWTKGTLAEWTLTNALTMDEIDYEASFTSMLNSEVIPVDIDFAKMRAEFLLQLIEKNNTVMNILEMGHTLGCVSYPDLDLYGTSDSQREVISYWFNIGSTYAFPCFPVDQHKFDGGKVEFGDNLHFRVHANVASFDISRAYATVIDIEEVCPTRWNPAKNEFNESTHRHPFPNMVRRLTEMSTDANMNESYKRAHKLLANKAYGIMGLLFPSAAARIPAKCKEVIIKIEKCIAQSRTDVILLTQTDGFFAKIWSGRMRTVATDLATLSTQTRMKVRMEELYRALLIVDKTSTSVLCDSGSILCRGMACNSCVYSRVARDAEHSMCEMILKSCGNDSAPPDIEGAWYTICDDLERRDDDDFYFLHLIEYGSKRYMQMYYETHIYSAFTALPRAVKMTWAFQIGSTQAEEISECELQRRPLWRVAKAVVAAKQVVSVCNAVVKWLPKEYKLEMPEEITNTLCRVRILV